ncbi:hypothetical protein HK405_009176 [Cladochytrium tenue]|nr:hypothetical protein HK405_009176 [Cladochytrium tenue]
MSSTAAAPAAPVAADAMLASIRAVIPPLQHTGDAGAPQVPTRKGLSGRVLVVGGSEEYSGAPFFAGMAALRTGADICHVVCDSISSPVIKGFSPDLIVHPYLRNISYDPTNAFFFATGTDVFAAPPHPPDSTYKDIAQSDSQAIAVIVQKVAEILERVHVVVIGPGLSRDPLAQAVAERILERVGTLGLPVVIDAGIDAEMMTKGEAAAELSRRLGNVLIMQKGSDDVLTDGTTSIACSFPGSPRRCGGQGDILSGTLATFLAWTALAARQQKSGGAAASAVLPTRLAVLSATAAAATVVRRASLLAFAARGRSMVARDVLEQVGAAFGGLWDGGSEEEGGGAKLAAAAMAAAETGEASFRRNVAVL